MSCVLCVVWCVVFGVWCVVCGVWCMVYGAWCVVCGVWRVVSMAGAEAGERAAGQIAYGGHGRRELGMRGGASAKWARFGGGGGGRHLLLRLVGGVVRGRGAGDDGESEDDFRKHVVCLRVLAAVGRGVGGGMRE